MTKLERVRTLAAIPAAFRGTGRVAKSLELLQGRTGGTLAFKPTVWKAAKPQLKLESGGKREELKRWRWKSCESFIVLKDTLLALEAAGIEPALQQRIKDQIRTMMKVDAPYAGMVRYFVREFQLVV